MGSRWAAMGGGEGLQGLAATRPHPWELPQLESGGCRAWSAVRCARWRGGALTWVFSRPRQCSGARHIHAPSWVIHLLCCPTAPLALRGRLPRRSRGAGCSAPPWLPRRTAPGSARLPSSASRPAGPREAALPALALRSRAGRVPSPEPPASSRWPGMGAGIKRPDWRWRES